MQVERRKKLLARVGKLIAQAEGTPYKEEAQVAYTMAQKILLENGLTMSEVDALTADEQRKLVANEEMTNMGKRHVDWLLRLARIIARNFRVRHYIYHHRWGKYQTHHIRMVGLAEDVTVARDVYASARAVAERLATAYAKAPGVLLDHLRQTRGAVSLSDVSAAEKAVATRQIKGIWREGFLDGLEARFAEQVKASASMALMLAVHPVVKEAYHNLGLGPSTYCPQGADVHNAAARAAGYKAGKEFSASPTQRLASATPRLKQG
jgi:hypothetical protein